MVDRHKAEVALEGREELLNKSAYSIESRLQLLGATGIEDKLQTGVPEAIKSLHAAGLKVWVLTGDKQETAINIGFSSGLIHPDDQISILNVYSLVSLVVVNASLVWRKGRRRGWWQQYTFGKLGKGGATSCLANMNYCTQYYYATFLKL